jgi:hypothetical protein
VAVRAAPSVARTGAIRYRTAATALTAVLQKLRVDLPAALAPEMLPAQAP